MCMNYCRFSIKSLFLFEYTAYSVAYPWYNVCITVTLSEYNEQITENLNHMRILSNYEILEMINIKSWKLPMPGLELPIRRSTIECSNHCATEGSD